MAKEKWDYAYEVFSALGNIDKLIELGQACLKDRQIGYALKAFEKADSTDHLNLLGEACLKEGLVSVAMQAYTAANNEMMIQFIRENFDEKMQMGF